MEPECKQHSTNNTQQTTNNRQRTRATRRTTCSPSRDRVFAGARRGAHQRHRRNTHGPCPPRYDTHPRACPSCALAPWRRTPHLTDRSSCTQPTRSRSLAGSFIPTRCRHALSHFADPDYVEYPSVPFGSPLRACRPGLCCGADHRHGDEHLLRREGRERDQARHAPRKPMHTRARTHNTHTMHRNPPAPPRPDPCVLGYASAQDSPGFAPVCTSADRLAARGGEPAARTLPISRARRRRWPSAPLSTMIGSMLVGMSRPGRPCAVHAADLARGWRRPHGHQHRVGGVRV